MTDPHVVVLMSQSPCEADPTSKCVMEVRGPFEGDEAAKAYAATWPASWNAHIMMLKPADR